jgi:ubiquinone/menaquinone biosynthesis C-methylase UbiE
MKSEVLELPPTIEHARDLARGEGIDDVVSHRVGDVLTLEMGEEVVDAAFLGNLIHHFTVDQNKNLLGRIEKALTNGGTIAIWDFKTPESGERPDLVGDALAMLFRITSETRCYSMDEIVEWLRSAGFRDITQRPTPLPSQMLVTGRARE